MSRQKRYIIYEEGQGYIKNIPENRLAYSLTRNKREAKKFTSLNVVESTIDDLILAGYSKDNQLHVFGYEEYESNFALGYKKAALSYAERYGIMDYKVEGSNMIFYVSYPEYLGNPRYTIKHTVNLDTGVDTPQRLKRFIAAGLNNRG